MRSSGESRVSAALVMYLTIALICCMAHNVFGDLCNVSQSSNGPTTVSRSMNLTTASLGTDKGPSLQILLQDTFTDSFAEGVSSYKAIHTTRDGERVSALRNSYAIVSSVDHETEIGRDLLAHGGILAIMFGTSIYVTPWIGLDIQRQDSTFSYMQTSADLRMQLQATLPRVTVSNNTHLQVTQRDPSLLTGWSPASMISTAVNATRIGKRYRSLAFTSFLLRNRTVEYSFVGTTVQVASRRGNAKQITEFQSAVVVFRRVTVGGEIGDWVLNQMINERGARVFSPSTNLLSSFGSVIASNGSRLVISSPESSDGGAIYTYLLSREGAKDSWDFVGSSTTPVVGVTRFGAALAMSSDLVVVGGPGTSNSLSCIAIYSMSSTALNTLIYTYEMKSSGAYLGASIGLEQRGNISHVVAGAVGVQKAYVWRVYIRPTGYEVTLMYSLESSYITLDAAYAVATTREMFFYSAPAIGYKPSDLKSYILVRVLCFPNRRVSSLDACTDCKVGTYSDGGITDTCTVCSNLPPNAHWIAATEGCEYECNVGFFGRNCVPCSTYALERGLLPPYADAEWVDGEEVCTWKCKLGYEFTGDGCVACNGFIPNNSTWIRNECSWECLSGYFGDECQLCSDYMKGEELPANSTWQDYENTCYWKCDPYFLPDKNSTRCLSCEDAVAKPFHSDFSSPSCAYTCWPNYYGESCLPCSEYRGELNQTAPINSYWSDNHESCCWDCLPEYGLHPSKSPAKVGSCNPKYSQQPAVCCRGSLTSPDTSTYDFSCNITCNDGYFNYNGLCVTCSEKMNATDTSLPMNADWVDGKKTCEWKCKEGYSKNGGKCCTSPVPNSEFISKDACTTKCKNNFFGNSCDICSVYSNKVGDALPPNAYWVDYLPSCFWACNTGYYVTSDKLGCCPVRAPVNGFVNIVDGQCQVSCRSGYNYNTETGYCDLIMCQAHGDCQSCLEVTPCAWCESNGACINLRDPAASCDATYIDTCPLSYIVIFGAAAGSLSGFFCILIICFVVRRRARQRRQAQICAFQAPSSRMAIINELEQKTLEEDIAGDPCTICYDDFVKGAVVRKLPCNHIFHLPCIDKWLMVSRYLACPICRDTIYTGVFRTHRSNNPPGDGSAPQQDAESTVMQTSIPGQVEGMLVNVQGVGIDGAPSEQNLHSHRHSSHHSVNPSEDHSDSHSLSPTSSLSSSYISTASASSAGHHCDCESEHHGCYRSHDCDHGSYRDHEENSELEYEPEPRVSQGNHLHHVPPSSAVESANNLEEQQNVYEDEEPAITNPTNHGEMSKTADPVDSTLDHAEVITDKQELATNIENEAKETEPPHTEDKEDA